MSRRSLIQGFSQQGCLRGLALPRSRSCIIRAVERLYTEVCLKSFRCQAITYEYSRGNCHPATGNFITEPEQNHTVRSVFVIYPKSLGGGNFLATPP
jgi:hypothetical protein